MASNPTPIIRKNIKSKANGLARYRYFSDDVTFTCKHILRIQRIIIHNMTEDDADYILELCNIDIEDRALNTYKYDTILEILNVMKKVFGARTFNEIVLAAKQ